MSGEIQVPSISKLHEPLKEEESSKVLFAVEEKKTLNGNGVTDFAPDGSAGSAAGSGCVTTDELAADVILSWPSR